MNTVRLKAKFSWAAFTLKPDQIDDAQELEASLSGSVPTQAFFEFKNQLIDWFFGLRQTELGAGLFYPSGAHTSGSHRQKS